LRKAFLNISTISLLVRDAPDFFTFEIVELWDAWKIWRINLAEKSVEGFCEIAAKKWRFFDLRAEF
jgi:hypothetical protein